MAENKENLPPPWHQDPLTSTPINRTPVKRLPTLKQTPISQDKQSQVTSGLVCFICGNAPQRLRNVCGGTTLPETSTILLSLKKCFATDLKLGKEWYKMKICVTCINFIDKANSFKDRVVSAVATISPKDVDHSLGCSVLLTPTNQSDSCRVKRLVPTDSTPTSSKRVGKKKCVGDSQRSLSFSSEQSSSYGSSFEEARSITEGSFEMYRSIMSEAPLDDDERRELFCLLGNQNTTVSDLAKSIFHSTLMTSLKAMMIREVNNTMTQLCSEKTSPGPSILRTHANPKDLQETDLLSEAVVELKTHQPFLCRLLTILCDPPGGTEQKKYTHHVIGTIYSMILYNRCRNVNALQKMNTAAAIRLHANNDLIEILHRCGIAMSESYKLCFLDNLGKFNTDGLMRSIQQGRPGKLTVDNIDGRTVAKEIRQGRGNIDYHYAASTYYPDRCLKEEIAHLSTLRPAIPEVINSRTFFLNAQEEAILKKNYGYQVHLL